MTLGAIGLAQSDPCYDPNGHPWYDWGLESIFNTPYECQCMVENNYPIGQRCATASGVAETMAGQAGGVVGGAANVVGEGLGTGIATGVGSFAQSINFSGVALLAVAGVIAYALLKGR